MFINVYSRCGLDFITVLARAWLKDLPFHQGVDRQQALPEIGQQIQT